MSRTSRDLGCRTILPAMSLRSCSSQGGSCLHRRDILRFVAVMLETCLESHLRSSGIRTLTKDSHKQLEKKFLKFSEF